MNDLHSRLVPRHPQRWWAWLVASQLLVAWLWWRLGWRIGLPCMFASHALFWWGAMYPRSQFYSPCLARLPTHERVVWLTIDDGPSNETMAMLDLLDAHDAKATFFVVGDRAAAHPELIREIVRRGHGIGNHSCSHPASHFWALGPRRMRAEITRCQDILRSITGIAPIWFRAVVGMANPFVAAPLRDLGLARVAWTARGYDGVAGNVASVVARIERDLAPGAIVLLHEGAAHGHNIDILREVLQRLDAMGFRAVLPEQLATITPDVAR
ncbi:polysaccharide deacetylase family protein [Solilutibacter silvestris]|uniref:Putative xylanase/chitin deacetylase n=1 Tax=Solilutibacter silvestris TaxID=1645665 RepID=A0A2K1Q1N7_9GAMM|nr:polysaccharide deacetylase family protein [Lysobacter silvestris]PNS08955.1 putative xylanase/chitin deacetylase [Lysobacter silvestris]